MAANATRQRFAPAVEPNVIPFIDVLLVLLIIFMVTAPKPATDLQVDMPPPGVSVASGIPPTVVAVRRGSAGAEYLVGAERVTLDQLGATALAAMLAADPRMTPEDAHYNGRVFVRADLDVGYQSVVSAVDTLEHARFRRVAIAAQNADAPG
jgi:biopolymer transport protein ExbD